VPKVTQEYRDKRRIEIQDAALRVFRKRGFAGTSIADIIAESGLSAGAIYGNFANKQEIVLSVAERVLGGRVVELRDVASRETLPTPGQVLRLTLSGLTRDLDNTGAIVQIWGAAAVDDSLGELVLTIVDRLRESWLGYLSAWARSAEGLAEAEAWAWAESMLPVMIGLAQGFIVQGAIFPGFDAENYLTRAEELLPH
jgi:AcrR family transcriptional regulator